MVSLAKRMPEQPAIRPLSTPAPTGGINRSGPASSMPATDCVYAYNVIAGELGLITRPGWPEWITGLTGGAGRTTLPFKGSSSSGSTDALFQTTPTGIWEASVSTAAPTQAIAFGTTTGNAGRGIYTNVTTPAERYFVYTDEENGLFAYPESSPTWAQIASGITQIWEPSTVYQVGDRVRNGANTYVCDTNGTSAGSGGPTGTTTNITDGTTQWDWVAAFSATAIGPSLADQRLGYTADPANFVFACVWKNLVFFVEKDTTRAWYSGLNALFGTYTSFDFGSKMRAGGALVGLYNWSYDGGSGLDTLLVGISGAGDVVIYQGTDPSDADAFGIKGAWFVDAIPHGRRIATEEGGELLVLSTRGIVHMSKLVAGASVDDPTIYATDKIRQLFSQLVSTYRTVPGWSLVTHPESNALIVTVPPSEDVPMRILAMSFAGERGWFEWRDMPVTSMAAWNGVVYFGTDDGRVCKNTGALDDVKLSDANDYRAVDWSVLPAFQNGRTAQLKQLQLIQLDILSDSLMPLVSATAKYDYDTIEPSPPSGSPSTGGSTWDGTTWDGGVWSGEATPSQLVFGAAGIGRNVSVAIRGRSISRTTLVGIHLSYTVGGVL